MSASPITPALVRFFTTTGTLAPLAFGKLYTYAAGTNTPLATYTDATGGSTAPNPIILDANGEAVVWVGDAAYKFNLLDSADVQQPNWPQDGIQTAAGLVAVSLAAAEAYADAQDEIAKDEIRAEIVSQTNTFFTTAGTAPAFTLTPDPPIVAYTAGLRYNIKWDQDSVSPNTLNISAVGAGNLKAYSPGGAKIDANVFAGWITDVEYDGTDFIILNSAQTGVTMGDNSTEFTATADWQCPSNITSVELLLVAAGGGGSGGVTNTRGGGGGGAGQSVKKWITVVPGTTYTVTIGTGGAGGAAGGSAGVVGGDSTMTGSGFTTITMAGGGGASGPGNGGAGGDGSAGGTFGSGVDAVDAVYKLWFDQGSTSEGAPGGGGGNIGLGQPAAGAGGDDWDFTGGTNGTTTNSSGPGGGGGASVMANGGAGSTGASASGTVGTLGSGGGGGSCSTSAQSAGGNGGNGYARIRF